jgi:DNA-binding transcriptional ArsR family regulator
VEESQGDPRAPRSVTRLDDPRALRALAHPLRLKLLALLRIEGPLTATRAAQVLGESHAACSFHLRQLAKYGMVEEAGGGQGRQRPWRATGMATAWPNYTADPETAAASGLVTSLIAQGQFEQLMRWLEAKPDEPEEWQRAAPFGDALIYVTPEELVELSDQVDALIRRYSDRLERPDARPDGSRLISYLNIAFPYLAPAPAPSSSPHAEGDAGDH